MSQLYFEHMRSKSVPIKNGIGANSGTYGRWGVCTITSFDDGARYSHSYTEALPDFVALAQAFGWKARRVNDPGELDAALAECLSCTGPFFLDVAVEESENCFPMIPSGHGHHQIQLAKDLWYREKA